MDKEIEVKTQKGFERCIKAGNIAIVRKDIWFAYGSAQVRAYGSAQVRAYGSAQVTASDSAQVRAYGSAQVRAYDSAQVTASGSAQVTAYGSAQVRAYGSAQVRAYGSAQVTASDSAQVTAYGSAQVRAYDSAQVRAYDYVAITQHSNICKIRKARTCRLIKVPPIKDINDYINRYPIEKEADCLILYKAVSPALKSLCSSTKITYPSQGIVEQKEISPAEDGCCAVGLHFAHFDWAVSFGMGYGEFVLLKARIPKDRIVVSPDCDGKIRTSYAEILEIIEDWQHYTPSNL